MTKFVAERRNELNSRPSAFFSVSLAAAGTEDQRQDAERYLRQFLERADWQPRMTAKFAGAVRYLEYGFLKRWMMKSIMKRAGRDTDTTRNHEYTDWDEVDQFATAFAQQCSTLDHDFRESVSAAAE